MSGNVISNILSIALILCSTAIPKPVSAISQNLIDFAAAKK
jgi:hypothetical protein